jgi:hypothetical protein
MLSDEDKAAICAVILLLAMFVGAILRSPLPHTNASASREHTIEYGCRVMQHKVHLLCGEQQVRLADVFLQDGLLLDDLYENELLACWVKYTTDRQYVCERRVPRGPPLGTTFI